MANRSTRIQGKVLRNLKRNGLRESDAQADEIYSEMQDAQDNIISTIEPDRNITITLEEDQETYPLTSETVSDPSLTTYKNNISDVKVIKKPTQFIYPFMIVSNTSFIRMIDGYNVDWESMSGLLGIDLTTYIVTGADMEGDKNGVNTVFQIPEDIVSNSEQIYFNGVLQVRDTDYTIVNSTITMISGLIPVAIDTLVCNYIKFSALGNTIVGTTQPLVGTVIGGRLRVYPIPTASYDGVEIELYVYIKSSAGTIDEDNEPELDDEWDKAIEYFATAGFLEGPVSDRYMQKFEAEKTRLQRLQHKSRGVIQRESAYEGTQNETEWYL